MLRLATSDFFAVRLRWYRKIPELEMETERSTELTLEEESRGEAAAMDFVVFC
jgi:hypothetical protein